ncbi:unnamed protein product [Ectocarpus sp. 12 AP-2014]
MEESKVSPSPSAAAPADPGGSSSGGAAAAAAALNPPHDDDEQWIPMSEIHEGNEAFYKAIQGFGGEGEEDQEDEEEEDEEGDLAAELAGLAAFEDELEHGNDELVEGSMATLNIERDDALYLNRLYAHWGVLGVYCPLFPRILCVILNKFDHFCYFSRERATNNI